VQCENLGRNDECSQGLSATMGALDPGSCQAATAIEMACPQHSMPSVSSALIAATPPPLPVASVPQIQNTLRSSQLSQPSCYVNPLH
jgi:hypothetical protein